MVVDIPRRISGARLSALTPAFVMQALQEACITKRHNVASSHFVYNRDKSLLVFRGKCRRSASRCATYSSTFCTTVVSEEIVSRYLSWGTERRELRWNRKMLLVIGRRRLGERYSQEDKTSRRKFCSSFKLYLTYSLKSHIPYSKTFNTLSIQFILHT